MDEKKSTKRFFPCPLCQRDLDIRVSKKRKPYCVCARCGVQLFIRGKEGISRLGKKTGFELDSFEILESDQGTKTLTQRKTELLKEEVERDEFDDWLDGL
jgi:hypothetical protein